MVCGDQSIFALERAQLHLHRQRPAGSDGRLVDPHASDLGRARLLVGLDRERDPLEREALGGVAVEHRERRGDVGGGIGRALIADEHVVEADRRLADDARVAGQSIGGRAGLALIGGEHVGHGKIGQQRREELVVDDLKVEGAAGGPLRRQRHRHRHERGRRAEVPGDRGGAIL